MLRFFRQIRKTLIEQNKVRTYLFYAIGEIALVMIGILLALQVNSWSNDRVNRKLEVTSLENLLSDLEIQSEILQEHIEYNQETAMEADSARLFLTGDISTERFIYFMDELAGRFTFIANRVTIDNLTSTGNLVLIGDQELQNKIIRYYQQLDYLTTVINNNNLKIVDDQFGSFLVMNQLKFKMDESLKIDENYELTPELRQTLNSNIFRRNLVTQFNIENCGEQLELTRILIDEIDYYLMTLRG